MKGKVTPLRAFCVGILMGAIVVGVPACDFERNRSFAVSGLLGFLAQSSLPNQIVVGRYCGQTAPSSGAPGGYAAIKTLCEAACGSSTAHFCSAHELQEGLAVGLIPPTNSWYSGFGISYDNHLGSSIVLHDCGGWKFPGGGGSGSLFTVSPVAPNRDFCTSMHPFACCDYVVLPQ